MNAASIELDISYHLDTTDFKIKDDSDRFRQAAEWVVQRCKLSSLSASISVVDDETIHRLNREHLQHDWPTDVISFVFDEADGHIDGEIIASCDTARRMHEKAGWQTEDELLLYVVHGLLHLAGLDDIEAEDRRAMRRAEQECLVAMKVEAANEHLDRWESVV